MNLAVFRDRTFALIRETPRLVDPLRLVCGRFNSLQRDNRSFAANDFTDAVAVKSR